MRVRWRLREALSLWLAAALGSAPLVLPEIARGEAWAIDDTATAATEVWPAGFRSQRGWRGSPLFGLPETLLPAAAPAFAGPSLLGPARFEPFAIGMDAAAGSLPPRASWAGWLPSLLLGGAWAGVQLGLDPPEDSRWSDRNSFDSAIRRGLRGGSHGTRQAAELAADVTFGVTAAALAADWWLLRDEYGFWRSVQVDTRFVFANNLATRVAKVAAGRQRPYVQPCGRDSDYIDSCGSGRDGNGGFWSGHASNTATIAGLLCARHLGRPEPGLLDAFVCGGAAAGALTTGILRIVSEHHFATDVLAGWATGAVFGYMLPRALNYGGDPGGALSPMALAPVVGRDYYGFRYGFRF